MTTDNKLPSIRCNYCKRIAYWVRPRAGVQICSSCKALSDGEQWDELALRWLSYHPKDWVPDVAAFLEVSVERSGQLEPMVVASVCDGCNGSKCGSDPHQYRKVLPTIGVVAKLSRAKEVDPDA